MTLPSYVATLEWGTPVPSPPRPQLLCASSGETPSQATAFEAQRTSSAYSFCLSGDWDIHGMEPPEGVVCLQDTPPMAAVQNARLSCSGANLFNGWVVFNPPHPFSPGTMNALFLTVDVMS